MIIRTQDDKIVSTSQVDTIYLQKNRSMTDLVGTNVITNKIITLGTWKTKGVAKEVFLVVFEGLFQGVSSVTETVIDIKKGYPKDRTQFNQERIDGQNDVIIHESEPINKEEEVATPEKK